MVQSINTKALLTLVSVLRNPGLLVPHITVNNISEIDYNKLKTFYNIQAIIFDKDNTITVPYNNQYIHNKAQIGIKNAIQTFGHSNIAILSNSAGTYTDDPNYNDAIQIETNLNINVIRHVEKKPGGLQDVLSHFHITDPSTICIIGDRILTDIVFGNLYGMLTIHTMPLCGYGSVPLSDNDTTNDSGITTTTTATTNDNDDDNKTDNWTAKIIRPIENSLLYNNNFIGRTLRTKVIKHKYWDGYNANSNNNNNNNINDENEHNKEQQQLIDAQRQQQHQQEQIKEQEKRL